VNQARDFVQSVPKAEWQPLAREGTVGVEYRVLLHRRGMAVATLRFAAHASIDEHSAAFEIDVVCLVGEGFVSVGGNAMPFRCGEFVTWPAHVNHRLWTDDVPMETLMVEHHEA
jgi:quercetin dioxygenase-like cupin family protein